MRRLRPSSEAEMVALFLRTELTAARFRDKLQALLERDGLPEHVITDPDLDDDAENQARLRLLTQHREYGTRTGLFDDPAPLTELELTRSVTTTKGVIIAHYTRR